MFVNSLLKRRINVDLPTKDVGERSFKD
jgi:hypothetical protein